MKAESKSSVASEDVLDLEIIFVSGALAASLSAVPVTDSVASVTRAASSAGPPGQLLYGAQVLDPRQTLQAYGINTGATLTLVRRSFTWDGARFGKQAVLSREAGGVVARRTQSFCHAVVAAAWAGREIRIRILETSHWSGAVELGFTATAPDDLPGELPAEARDLPLSWIMGNSGNVLVNGVGLKAPTPRGNWTTEWRPGDVATCTATDAGWFRVDVNGALAMSVPADIPTDIQIYPVVGVYGKTTAIELLDG